MLDPGQNIHDRRDIAFRSGKVAAVAERIPSSQAKDVIDVSGKLVTPGLVDLHGHFYDGSCPSACRADEACLPAGVTTAVDAGTAGWANYPAMRDYVFPTQKTRLLAFLHIGAVGLTLSRVLGGDLQDLRVIDVDRTVDAIKANPRFLLGVKVRMHVDAVVHWEARNALNKAKDAAKKAGVRLMVHIAGTPIPLAEILSVLEPGDIATHIYNGEREGIIGPAGKVRSEVWEAARRGVVLDVAHGGGHLCDLEVAKGAIDQGLLPSTISTDMNTPRPGRRAYAMNDLISQFHAMGMSLEDAVAASTSQPAKAIGLESQLGSLAPGMAGDGAVFTLTEGKFTWPDLFGQAVDGKLRLDTFLTVRDGSVVWKEGQKVS